MQRRNKGHHQGDLLLQQVGLRLREILRASDTVARLGGDEFALLLPNVEIKGAIQVAHKILETLEASFALGGQTLDVRASIGIALFPDHCTEADPLVQKADVAMYVAKQSGGGYAVYCPEQDQQSDRLSLIGELRQAIDQEQLFLLFQPKIDLQKGRFIGVEALVRWQHPRRGLIPPDDFIRLAEQSRLMKPLTLWVLTAALRQCRIWRQEGMRCSVAVNLSARNLQDRELPDQVAEVIQKCGLDPSCLELEITEGIIMADPVRAKEVLTSLSKMGIELFIDDFGTGYSSLGYIKKLPVSAIKIDKSFVKEMALNLDDAMIVHSTIELGHNLGLKVLAEGVEDQETWEELIALGCDAAQGYYISRPLSPPELNRWLREIAPLKGWTVCGSGSGAHGA